MLPQVNIIRARHGDFLAFFESQGISGVLTAYGVWDEASISIAARLLESIDNPVIYDVGANIGTFAVPIAKMIARVGGKVHAFEPQRIVSYQLCGNVFLNRLDNVYVHQVAVGGVEQIQPIQQLDFSKAWNIGAYSLVDKVDQQERSSETELCRFVTLDQVAQPDSISLLKVDVEGMEAKVFQGALKVIEKSGYPPILFESRDADEESGLARKILIDLGYELKIYSQHDYLAQHISRSKTF